jgi:methylthioribulose-1-phosphate dehydratase
VVQNSQDMLALSQMVPHCINPEVPGLILQGHGLYAWGDTPFEAKRHVEIWEYLFQYRVTEMMLGSSASQLAPLLLNKPAS